MREKIASFTADVLAIVAFVFELCAILNLGRISFHDFIVISLVGAVVALFSAYLQHSASKIKFDGRG